MNKDMKLNVKFNLDYIRKGKVNLLFHYYNMLDFARSNKMSLKEFPFKNCQRYTVLRDLIELGWVGEDLSMKPYELVVGCGRNYFEMDTKYLKTKKDFKGFLLAATEAYALNIKNQINEGTFKVYNKDCDEYVPVKWQDEGLKGFNATQSGLDEGDNFYLTGRVSNKELQKILGIGSTTLKIWRSYSRELNINQYKVTLLEVKEGHYKSNEKSGYFLSKGGVKLSYEHNITTNITIEYDYQESEETETEHIVQVQGPVSDASTTGRDDKVFSEWLRPDSSAPRGLIGGGDRGCYESNLQILERAGILVT